tara:strand:+ start:8463 stop:8606 length:144 start_codon:yes stop_codon:yes gene_type:complete
VSLANINTFNVKEDQMKYKEYLLNKSNHSKNTGKWISISEWKKQIIE